jgi:hypothetical protein
VKANMLMRHMPQCESCADFMGGNSDAALCVIGDAMREDMLAGIASRFRVPRRKMWYVNVYEVDRAYGGPEEGSWYYDTGDPVHEATETYFTEDFAWFRARILGDTEWTYDGLKVGSVNYRGGQYRVMVQDHPAKAYPEETPHYE